MLPAWGPAREAISRATPLTSTCPKRPGEQVRARRPKPAGEWRRGRRRRRWMACGSFRLFKRSACTVVTGRRLLLLLGHGLRREVFALRREQLPPV